jgi:hypothetical protein
MADSMILVGNQRLWLKTQMPWIFTFYLSISVKIQNGSFQQENIRMIALFPRNVVAPVLPSNAEVAVAAPVR